MLEPWAPTTLKVRDWRRAATRPPSPRDSIGAAHARVVGRRPSARVHARSAERRRDSARSSASTFARPHRRPSDAGDRTAAAHLARAAPPRRLRRRDRPAVRRRARHLPPARRPARARRPHRGHRAARRAAASGEVIDARDATVIPGLIDVHAHSSSLAGERLGRAWLAYGVTTVRELATTPAEAVGARRSLGQRPAPGPRL